MNITIRLRMAGIAAAMIAGVSICIGGLHAQQRDSGGRIMEFSDWKTINPDSFIVNIATLKNIEISRAQQRVRDNRIFHQRVSFDGKKGFLFVAYNYTGRYNDRVTRRYQNSGQLKKSISRFAERRSLDFRLVGERRIREWGDRGGWIHQMEDSDRSANCIFARMGFLSDFTKQSSGEEHYDTLVFFRDCSAKRSLDDVERFLMSMKVKG